MKIKLSFVGYLEFKDVKSGDSLELADGMSVTDLLTEYNIQKSHQRHIIPIVHGVEKRRSHVLQDGDELTLFIPIGGG